MSSGLCPSLSRVAWLSVRAFTRGAPRALGALLQVCCGRAMPRHTQASLPGTAPRREVMREAGGSGGAGGGGSLRRSFGLDSRGLCS